jgi:hypothetical protein
MHSNLQASEYVHTPDALPTESEDQVLVLLEDELERVAGGNGRTAGLFMSE